MALNVRQYERSKKNICVEFFLVMSFDQSIELTMIGLWLNTLQYSLYPRVHSHCRQNI